MRITFVLPDFVPVPVGGIKVLYEVANGLARRDHQVTVLHLDTLAAAPRSVRLRHQLRFAAFRRGRGGWFRLDRVVATGLIDPTRPEALPDGDVVIAGSWRVAPFVDRAPVRAGERFYLAQGYMEHEGGPGEVDAAWRLPLRKIVIAAWLEAKARELGGPGAAVTRMPMAIDHDAFSVTVDPAARQASTAALLSHGLPSKGTRAGLAALEAVQVAIPSLRVTMFGTETPDFELPKWATFKRRPRDLAALYNAAAIFIHPSTLEGWPLTPAEAMASGCAVAAYANDGVLEYAVNEHNALLVEPGDVDGLAAAIRRLTENDDLRVRLARQGASDMAAYTWPRTVAALEAALERH